MDSPCDYEEDRARRIAENMKRLAELGVVETASQLAPQPPPRRRTNLSGMPRSPRARKVAASDEPVRRSGRLDGKPARCYSEDPAAPAAASKELRKLKGGNVSKGARERVTSADEVYSQAHVDSLGTHCQPWELFVDGYDLATGRRIYDASRGHTCHQCRQKTLGTHTACDCCGRLSGIFCGDCLFMRYGENVREANAAREAARARRAARAAAAAGAGAGASSSGGGSENGNENEQQQDFGWACPPCRGLCNCSFHRARRGWAPTGSLYRHALAEGYASVAHFLVLTSVEEGVVVPPGLRQGKRQEEEGGNGNTAAALPSTRPVSAAAGLLRDPPVTTTVARGGKPKASSSKSNAVKSPGSPPLPSAKRAEATRRRSLGTSSSSPNRQQQQQQQLTSPTLEPAPVAVVPSLLPNGKRRTGSFMSQLRLNPEALKRRRGGAAAANRGKATATAKTPASASAAEKKKKPAAKKAAVSISPRAPGVSRRSIRGSVGVEVAAAC